MIGHKMLMVIKYDTYGVRIWMKPDVMASYGITEKDILVHDKTTEDTGIHMMLAHMAPPHFPVAIGVIRDVKAPTFNDSLDEVIANEKANSKIHCMDDLLNSGSTWDIE